MVVWTVELLSRLSRAMLDWHYAPTSRRGEVMTDMPFPLYPPGMYQVSMPMQCTVKQALLYLHSKQRASKSPWSTLVCAA